MRGSSSGSSDPLARMTWCCDTQDVRVSHGRPSPNPRQVIDAEALARDTQCRRNPGRRVLGLFPARPGAGPGPARRVRSPFEESRSPGRGRRLERRGIRGVGRAREFRGDPSPDAAARRPPGACATWIRRSGKCCGRASSTPCSNSPAIGQTRSAKIKRVAAPAAVGRSTCRFRRQVPRPKSHPLAARPVQWLRSGADRAIRNPREHDRYFLRGAEDVR